AAGGGVDPLGGEAGKEVGKIRHGLVSRCRRSYHLAASAFTNVGNQGTLASHDSSVPIPKFAHPRGTLRCELRNQRDTSNFMILVRHSDLKFLNELAAIMIGT